MAEMFVPKSVSPMHQKPPSGSRDKHSHDLSTPMAPPKSGAGMTPPVNTGGRHYSSGQSPYSLNDFENHASPRSSFSMPIDDPIEEVARLRQVLEEKESRIKELERDKIQFLKKTIHTTNVKSRQSPETSRSIAKEPSLPIRGLSDDAEKKLKNLQALKESKEMMCLKLNKEVKDLCMQNAKLKDEITGKSSILEEYKKLIDKLEEENEELKTGGGPENREREALLEKMLDEISQLNEDLDRANSKVEELTSQSKVDAEDSSKEIEYLQSLLMQEEKSKRSDDEVVVDVLNQMENARLSKFIYSLIKMDGKDVLDIQDLIALLESGTISMRRRQAGGADDEDGDVDDQNSPPKPIETLSNEKLDLNIEKKCIVRLMDFLSDEQLLEVANYLREFSQYSSDFDDKLSSSKRNSPANSKQVQINEDSAVSTDEHVCFTITRNDGEEEIWMELVDPSTNLKYYHNPDLNLTQWELPSEIQSYLNKEFESSKD